MEPEHEIFFLGWRAHGLRAMECTTISILHHGWCGGRTHPRHPQRNPSVRFTSRHRFPAEPFFGEQTPLLSRPHLPTRLG